MSDRDRDQDVFSTDEQLSDDELGASRSARRSRRRRSCPFCVEKVREVNYKDPDMLRRFVNEEGKIRPRRQTNVCAKHQRSLAQAVKRARYLALLPYTGHHVHG